MATTVTEEVRFPGGFPGDEIWLTGVWSLPRTPPPHPLVVLFAEQPGRDSDGATPDLLHALPSLEVVRRIGQAGCGSFRYGVPKGVAAAPTWLPAWRVAVDHPRISRLRVVMVALGSAAGGLVPRVAELAHDRTPRGLVIACPPRDLDWSALRNVRTLLLLTGATEQDAHRISSAARAAGANLVARAFPDTTGDLIRTADAIAGRQVPDPDLITAVSEGVLGFLESAWELPARPPGLAIGEA